ncbi:MAG: DUF3054 domain-containing protein [Halobacteriales archaeon]
MVGTRDSSFRRVVLAGDVAVVLLLVGVGLESHGSSPVRQPVHWLVTAAPFVVGWLVTSYAFDTLSPDVYGELRPTAVRVPLAWVSAAALGAVLRYGPRVAVGEPPELFTAAVFASVMTGFGLSLLLPWRLLVVFVCRRG